VWSGYDGAVSAPVSDTSTEAAAVQGEAFRRAGAEGRLRMALQMSDEVASLLEAGVRQRHPEYSARDVRLAAIRLRLGDELFKAVYRLAQVEP
jgi:hypothetical protein